MGTVAVDKSSMQLKCSNISGKEVALAKDVGSKTWREVRLLMARQLHPYLTMKLKFALPTGSLLTRDDDAKTIEEIFDLGQTMSEEDNTLGVKRMQRIEAPSLRMFFHLRAKRWFEFAKDFPCRDAEGIIKRTLEFHEKFM